MFSRLSLELSHLPDHIRGGQTGDVGGFGMAQTAAEVAKGASDHWLPAILNNRRPLRMVIRKPIGRIEVIVNLLARKCPGAAGYALRHAIIFSRRNILRDIDGIDRKCPRPGQIFWYSPLLSEQSHS